MHIQKVIAAEELAKQLGGSLVLAPHIDHLIIEGAAALDEAQHGHVSFFHNPRHQHALKNTQAGLVIAREVQQAPSLVSWLLHPEPSKAFQTVLEWFYPILDTYPYHGLHATACIDPSAQLGSGVTIGPYGVVGPRAIIGESSYVGPHCVIGSDVVLGKGCILHPHVVVRESCTLGDQVILQPGVVIGGCGYGYNTSKGKHYKLDHRGGVILEDQVEIGAGSCIDRGRFKPTRIRRGTKIDNLVMIGHGVEIGEDNLIVGQAGIAGSTHTGDHVVVGGQAGIAGHLHLAPGVEIAAKAGVTKDLAKGKYGGIPAVPMHQWVSERASLRRIARLEDELKELRKQIT